MHPSPASPFVVVLTTLDEQSDASVLARTLVEERLAACVNVLPAMRSIYRWQGSVESAQERQLIIKTTTDRLPALKARLAVLHPYEVPEMLVLTVADASASYGRWLEESVR
jgi:periplasmic divalent cation tolerance protein